MKPALLFLLLEALLAGCSQTDTLRTSTPCAGKPELVYLYVDNNSMTDTLAPVSFRIDDSIYVEGNVSLNRSSEEQLYKTIILCRGPHHIAVAFGRYQRDTTLRIEDTVSLGVAMDYNPHWPAEFNGTVIWLLNRDGGRSRKRSSSQ